MAGNYSYAKVKTFLIFGSILVLSINSITILCMNDEFENFVPPSQEEYELTLSGIQEFCKTHKNPQSKLTLSLRNSTEIVPKKPKLKTYLKKQLDACFEAIRNNKPNELKKYLVAGIAPGILYDGYEKTLYQAQFALWQSIQGEPFFSTKQAPVQSILSLLLQRTKEEENDNDKK